MISDAAVSEKVQGQINAINEAAKAEHSVLTREEKRKIYNLYLQLLQLKKTPPKIPLTSPLDPNLNSFSLLIWCHRCAA